MPVLIEGSDSTATEVREEGTKPAAPCTRDTDATAGMWGTRPGMTRTGLGKAPNRNIEPTRLPKRRQRQASHMNLTSDR
jgi:hypothetical protein